MNETLAKLTSNIFNPFLVSIAVLSILAMKAVSNQADAVKWILVTVAISVLPAFLIVLCLLRLKKLDGFFSNPRQQRTRIYIITSFLAVVDCILLWIFQAPQLLTVTFTAGLIAIIAFMIINYFWKISLHTAFIAASGVVSIITYGAVGAWALLLFPLVGWSRIVLKQHTLAQVMIGGLLAAVIVSGVFWGFGLVG